jgi:hypothetical protein
MTILLEVINKERYGMEQIVLSRFDLPLLSLNYDIKMRRLEVSLIDNDIINF